MGDDPQQIEELCHKATSSMLFQPDWEANMEIVDLINQKPFLMDVVITYLRNRLKKPKTEMVIVLIIELFDTMMKNCYDVEEHVGRKDVMDELIRIGSDPKPSQARTAVLEFVQFYQNAFLSRENPNVFFSYAMKQLRTKVQMWPALKQDIYTPLKRVPAKSHHGHIPVPASGDAPSPAAAAPSRPRPSGSIDSGRIQSEMPIVRENASLLRDILNNLAPGDNVTDHEIIVTLVPQVREMHDKLVRVIEQTGGTMSDSLLAQLLSVNDELDEVIKQYERAKQAQGVKKAPPPPASHAEPVSPMARNLELQEARGHGGHADHDLTVRRKLKKGFAELPPAAPAGISPTKAAGTGNNHRAAVDDLLGLGSVESSGAPAPDSSPIAKLSPPRSGSTATPLVAKQQPDDINDEFAALATRKRPDSQPNLAANVGASPAAAATTTSPPKNPFDALNLNALYAMSSAQAPTAAAPSGQLPYVQPSGWTTAQPQPNPFLQPTVAVPLAAQPTLPTLTPFGVTPMAPVSVGTAGLQPMPQSAPYPVNVPLQPRPVLGGGLAPTLQPATANPFI